MKRISLLICVLLISMLLVACELTVNQNVNMSDAPNDTDAPTESVEGNPAQTNGTETTGTETTGTETTGTETNGTEANGAETTGTETAKPDSSDDAVMEEHTADRPNNGQISAPDESVYQNVTVAITGRFKDASADFDPTILLIDKGQLYYIDGEPLSNESKLLVRLTMIEPILTIADKMDQMTFNAAKGAFCYKDTLVHKAYAEGQVDAIMAMTNLELYVDSQGRITRVTCDMIQEGTCFGESLYFELSVVFTLSDYGTTTIPAYGDGDHEAPDAEPEGKDPEETKPGVSDVPEETTPDISDDPDQNESSYAEGNIRIPTSLDPSDPIFKDMELAWYHQDMTPVRMALYGYSPDGTLHGFEDEDAKALAAVYYYYNQDGKPYGIEYMEVLLDKHGYIMGQVLYQEDHRGIVAINYFGYEPKEDIMDSMPTGGWTAELMTVNGKLGYYVTEMELDFYVIRDGEGNPLYTMSKETMIVEYDDSYKGGYRARVLKYDEEGNLIGETESKIALVDLTVSFRLPVCLEYLKEADFHPTDKLVPDSTQDKPIDPDDYYTEYEYDDDGNMVGSTTYVGGILVEQMMCEYRDGLPFCVNIFSYADGETPYLRETTYYIYDRNGNVVTTPYVIDDLSDTREFVWLFDKNDEYLIGMYTLVDGTRVTDGERYTYEDGLLVLREWYTCDEDGVESLLGFEYYAYDEEGGYIDNSGKDEENNYPIVKPVEPPVSGEDTDYTEDTNAPEQPDEHYSGWWEERNELSEDLYEYYQMRYEDGVCLYYRRCVYYKDVEVMVEQLDIDQETGEIVAISATSLFADDLGEPIFWKGVDFDVATMTGWRDPSYDEETYSLLSSMYYENGVPMLLEEYTFDGTRVITQTVYALDENEDWQISYEITYRYDEDGRFVDCERTDY